MWYEAFSEIGTLLVGISAFLSSLLAAQKSLRGESQIEKNSAMQNLQLRYAALEGFA